jgi:alginate O-acetyltransferase complex protein AlgJ
MEIFDRRPRKENLKRWEEDLDQSSVARRVLQPRVQEWLSAGGGFGNTKVVMGHNGWLYFRPGVDWLTGRGILTVPQINNRYLDLVEGVHAPRQWDPRLAIIEFNKQCAAAGAHLIIVPIPDKAALQPGELTRRMGVTAAPVTNADYAAFLAELRGAAVDVFDPTPRSLSSAEPLFLAQDTHWTPQWMKEVAAALAVHIWEQQLLPQNGREHYQIRPQTVSRVGDLVDLLKLPAGQRMFAAQNVRIEQVIDERTNQFWRSRDDAAVLLLGDSFTNIFSAEGMGWGESAGFAEHLSARLRSPLTRIAQNDAGAYATRRTLAGMLARGKDVLAGKKVVVWEFAARELAVGDWRAIEMKLGHPSPAGFLTMKAGEAMTVTGTVDAVAAAVRPGTVPYKDHVVAVHLIDIRAAREGSQTVTQALVYMYGMRDNVLAPAARYSPEQRVTLRLRPWGDVSGKLDAINRAELNDDELNLSEPLWGEEVR